MTLSTCKLTLYLFQQDRSPTIKLGYLNKLPERLKAEMTSSSGLDLHQMAEDQKCEDYARNGRLTYFTKIINYLQ